MKPRIKAGKLLALYRGMKLMSFGLTAALLTTLTAVPAFAQERDQKRREAARAEQNAQRQAQPQREAARAAQPRVEQPQRGQAREQSQRSEQARSVEQARPRRAEAPRVQAPTVQTPAVQAPVIAPRADTRSNEMVGRAVPRTGPSYGERDHRNDRAYAYAPRVYAPRVYAPRVYAPHAYIVRPYVFRPHVSIGFGIYAGYPAPYAWQYPAPIYVYGYRAPRAPVYITPGTPLYGGIALEMSPYDAAVYVDGNYAGRVQDFDGTVQPLTVVAGTHRLEVQAPGYAPLLFDVVVEGGQVVPYRGDLQPL